ncbi:hypothetical protein CsSME_00050424 [Camellia sinensis var. sinensis]
MFKSARWRTEKNKVKAVFKLHFHATQLAQVRGDGLMISLVAADVGKPTVKLEKATIRDGSCYWENPVSETVTFFREPKSGKIREKIYYFVVSTGSSKADLVGEVSIDFASYAESTKLSSVSLPLKNAKSDAVLHVSIQRLQENVDQREDEETETTKNHSVERSLKTQLPVGDTNGSIKNDSSEDGPFNKTISHIIEVNGNDHRASSGSDLTISSSESISGLDTPREFRVKNNNVHLNPTSFLSSPKLVLQKSTSNVSTTIHEEQQRSQWEWLGGSAPEASTDDSSTSPDDALLGEKSQEALDNVIEKLKTELSSLSRHAEMLELELQTLRKQIVKEGKKGQDLFKEVVSLKDERNALKEECEKLKAFKSKSKFEGGNPRTLLEELRQEINYEKDLNANLRIQLQKTQESNSELILAVRDLDEMLEQKDREIFKLSNGSRTGENAGESRETNSKSETDDDEEQKALEELVKEHSDEKEAHMLEEKITDLYSDLAIYQRDKDELEVQMEHLALDYEILKQENHELLYKLEQSQVQEQLKLQYECSSSFATVNELEIQIENLESELNKQATEFSDSLATITQLETHIKDLEDDLEKQAQGFEADLEILTRAKVEQEQRAIRAEDDLRKMRSKNVDTAERLQEEFRRLSMQMTSTFEANEKMATKALTEAGELRLQKNHLEELLQVAKEELEIVRDHYEAKLHELSSQISIKVTQIEWMESEIEAKSKQLEQGKKNGEETRRVLSHDIIMLRAEIEMLKTENNILSDEREQMKASMKETEMLLQRGNAERSEMESVIALLRKEADKSMEELNILKSLKDEKESIIRNLKLELESLKSECNELERSLVENEFEKEKLRKEVLQVKGNLKKKEDALNSLEKKLKDNNSRSTVLDGTKTPSRNNKSAAVTRGPKEIANLKDKLKLLEGQIKLKEAALETSTNSFLEKEKDLQNKIEELERRLEELNENSAQYEFQKVSIFVAKDSKNITINSIPEEVNITAESNNEISSEKAMEASALNARDERNLDKLLNEMALLRERNKSMEDELKEMQERYSEISLKFAEVEGERQQLVMKVRYLKNARKI